MSRNTCVLFGAGGWTKKRTCHRYPSAVLLAGENGVEVGVDKFREVATRSSCVERVDVQESVVGGDGSVVAMRILENRDLGYAASEAARQSFSSS